MAKGKVKVTLNPSFLRKVNTLNREFVDAKLAKDVGEMLVKESKKLIAAGLSPVRGVGRFEAYKNPDSYPGNLKSARPVNLSLTGKMLSFLNYRKNGNTIDFGILGAPTKVATIARVHNTGERSDIPQRQFIPEGEDNGADDFVPSIAQKLRNLFRQRVIEILGGLKK